MRHLATISAASLLFATQAQAQDNADLPLPWLCGQSACVTGKQVRFYANSPINLITGVSSGARGPQTPGVWTRVDLKPWGIPADAAWVELSGVMLITSGSTTEIANITVTMRRPGDTTAECSRYVAQAAAPSYTGGTRVNVTVTVPLVNGEFEWCYVRATYGVYPTNSTYGVNLAPIKWGR